MMKNTGNTRNEKEREPMRIVPMRKIPKKTKQISETMELEMLKKERKLLKFQRKQADHLQMNSTPLMNLTRPGEEESSPIKDDSTANNEENKDPENRNESDENIGSRNVVPVETVTITQNTDVNENKGIDEDEMPEIGDKATDDRKWWSERWW